MCYAGTETFIRVKDAIKEVFGCENVLPAHQGRACENILAEAYCGPGKVALMNFHFTTAKAHITRVGATVEELVDPKGLIPQTDDPFKGNFNLENLASRIDEIGKDNVAFVRVESGTNLIGGLEWVEEPAVLRFFFGTMKEIGNWQEKLVEKFKADFGDSL